MSIQGEIQDFKNIKIMRKVIGVYTHNSDQFRKSHPSYYHTESGDYLKYLSHGEVKLEVMKDLLKAIGIDVSIYRTTFSRQCVITVNIKL